MLIVLNGLPGVGKLTVGRLLADQMKAKLLDNHTIYNLAFALTDFKSLAFYEAARRAQALAYDIVRMLPPTDAIVMTEIFVEGSDWAQECWERAMLLADTHGPLMLVNLSCSVTENIRRVQVPDRALKGKLNDPEVLRGIYNRGRALMTGDGRKCVHIDTTDLQPSQVVQQVLGWLDTNADRTP